jgi:spore coat polysaccharide biosynthesis predicted glycosyltransferase SpsG
MIGLLSNNTYLMNSEHYKSSEIPTHDLHRANNVIFNYKYDLVITRSFIAAKDFRKTTKSI